MNHELSVGSVHADPITQTTPANIVPDVNGSPNGHSNINGDIQREPTSPAADSPATPVSNVAAPNVKFDPEFQEQESDARHEPVPLKSIAPIEAKPAVIAVDDASTIAQSGTPVDPGPSCFPLFFPARF